MLLLLGMLAFVALTAVLAIRARRQGRNITSVFFTIVAWTFLGFVLFVLLL
jgi:hypothetical protein